MPDILLSIDKAELRDEIDLIVKRTTAMDLTWEWPCGVAFYGISKAWEATGNDSYMEYLQNWVEEYLAIGLPPFQVNTVAMGHALISLYQYSRDKKYLDLALQKASYLEKDALRFSDGVFQHTVSSKNDFPGQAWADTLFMAAYFLLRMGRLTENKSWISDALHQFVRHEELLQDPESDLFYHGYEDQTKSHMSGQYWGRANAWAALTMAEVHHYVNYLYPEFMAIDGALRDQLSALVRLQTENGLWRTVLNDGESYEEVSASSGIAAALVLNGNPLHRKYILPAYEGIRKNIDARGMVRSVSAGTAVMKSLEDYRLVPRKRIQGWGQGLTLSFLAALLQHINAAGA